MEVLLSKNRYIKIFNSIYNKYSKMNRFVVEDHKENIEKGLFKKQKVIITDWNSKDYFKNEAKEELDHFIKKDFKPSEAEAVCNGDQSTNVVRTFDQMWEFCQFVKYAEKCIFYENDANNPFYVDSDMLSEDAAIFTIFNDGKYRIKFKLESKHDSITNTDLNIITVESERFYGRKMTNKFTIVNGVVQFNDIADSLLIDVINSILYDTTYRTFISIVDELESFFDNRVNWNTESITLEEISKIICR